MEGETPEFGVFPLRDAVLFPENEQTFHVGRKQTLALLDSLDASLTTPILVVSQLVPEIEHPQLGDLHTAGVIARVQSITRRTEGGAVVYIVAVRGISRVRLSDVTRTTPFLHVRVVSMPATGTVDDASLAEVRELWPELARKNGVEAPLIERVANTTDAEQFINLVAANVATTYYERRDVLAAADIKEQVTLLLACMRRLGLDAHIRRNVKKQMQASQREYYLREQLRAIQAELGDARDQDSPLQILRKALNDLPLPDSVRALVSRTESQMERQSESAAEYTVGLRLLQHIADLPWTPHTAQTPDVAVVRSVLDSLHYGADEVADWIVEELATRSLQDRSGQALCLVGPPGVGKTTLAQAIARALDRPLQTISLAGAGDTAFIRGHRRTYIGSEPGMLTTALQTAGMLAPVILLDEIDKASRDTYRGNIGATLLQALDPSLNRHYLDEYFGFTIDLSQVLFIATANRVQDIYPPLRSRMRILTFWGYSADEKIAIARDYLLGRMIEAHGLTGRVHVDADALERLIERYTQEPGVRDLARFVERICRRCAALLAGPGASDKTIRVTASSLDSFLGVPRVAPSLGVPPARVGRVNAIAMGDGGTSVLPIDSIRFHGRGKLVVSGSEDALVRERVQVAMSVTRHRARRLGFDPDELYSSDMHVHLDSSIASADVDNVDLAICLSLVSALIGKEAPPRSAVIGAVDLHGDVRGCNDFLPRMAAAQRQRIEEVIVPASHADEVARLPHRISNGLRVCLVSSIDEAVEVLFRRAP